MQADNNEQDNIELNERIESIKNISYIAYSDSQMKIMICTAICALFIISAPYLVIATSERGWQSTDSMSITFLTIWVPIILGIAVVIISAVLFSIYANKQYIVECENGKTILAIGSFRRFRKYYVGKFGYKVQNGMAWKISAKKGDTAKTLFTVMKKSALKKKTSGNKEVFSIAYKDHEDFFSVGTMPSKYGTMKFINGKFKKGSYTSSTRHNALYIKVVKNDVKFGDVIPSVILNLK